MYFDFRDQELYILNVHLHFFFSDVYLMTDVCNPETENEADDEDEGRSQIYNGDPRPHIPTCVMTPLAMGLKVRMFIFTLRSKCRWYAHLTNHGYFGYGQKLEDLLFEPQAKIKYM